MDSRAIRDAIDNATSYLSEHPAEARYLDTAATAILETGLRVTVEGPDGAAIATDMPRSVGGDGSAPSPGWVMPAAQASCLATLIAARMPEATTPMRS